MAGKFDNEIKSSMKDATASKSKGKPAPPAADKGGTPPKPEQTAARAPNAVAAPPLPPHTFKDSTNDAGAMHSMQYGQQPDVPGFPPVVPQQGGDGLQQAHHTIVQALMHRDRGGM